MRKALMILLAISWLPSRAQFEKGATYWGGTVRFEGNVDQSQIHNDPNFKRTSHQLSPEMQWGRFVRPTTLVGIGIQYEVSYSRSSPRLVSSGYNDYRSLNQSVGLLPFVRKYRSLSDRWAIFIHAEAGAAYQRRKTENESNNQNHTNTKDWQYKIGANPGLVYFFPKRKFALEAYVDVLSIYAIYGRGRDPDRDSFRVSAGAGTRFPNYLTLRIARYSSNNAN